MSKIQQIINTMPSQRGRRVLRALRDIAAGDKIPAAALTGYKPGHIFHLKNAALGQSPLWINQGTEASCLFVPFGPVNGYGFAFAGGPVDLTDAAALATVSLPSIIQQNDICFATKCVQTGADQFRSIAPTSGKDSLAITMNAGNPTDSMDAYYAGIRNKCVPEFDIWAAGEYTAVGADDTTIAITITGLLATDIAFVTPLTTNDQDTINLVVCTANTLTITVSADPVTDHSYSYVILRKRGTFAPSHYIAYAGQATTVGTAASETFTVSGVLATDIVIGQWGASDDDNCFIEALIAIANGLTIECTDDPVTDHVLNYMAIRAY